MAQRVAEDMMSEPICPWCNSGPIRTGRYVTCKAHERPTPEQAATLTREAHTVLDAEGRAIKLGDLWQLNPENRPQFIRRS